MAGVVPIVAELQEPGGTCAENTAIARNSVAKSARAQSTGGSAPQGHPGHLPAVGASSRGAAGAAVHHRCGGHRNTISGGGGRHDGDLRCVNVSKIFEVLVTIR